MKAIRLLSIYDVSAALGACSIFVQTLENFKHAVWNKNINLKAAVAFTMGRVLVCEKYSFIFLVSSSEEIDRLNNFNFIAIFR